MAKRRVIGIQFDPEEIKRSVKIKLDPETMESLFPKKTGKDAYDYIKEFLQSDELYDEIFSGFNALIHSSLSEEEKNSCPCKDPNRKTKIEDNERACATQWQQFQFAYLLSAQDYVRTVLHHKVIYDDKEALKELTVNYYNCFEVLPRVVYFDVDKLAKYALDANFKALSKIFEGSETLNYLKGINQTIDVLGEEEINNELFEKEDENFVALQIKFLERKRAYLNNKLLIAKEQGVDFNIKKASRNIDIRPNTTDLAFHFYYLSQANINVTQHTFPSVLAWEEIGKKFDRNAKNIQKTYNLLMSNSKNRLKKRRNDNLEYVINNMLNNYPKALNLAKDELKLAKTHW